MTLLAKVKSFTVEVGDCWEWLGAFNGKVPMMRVGKKMMAVRRALVLHEGKELYSHDYITCGCGNWRCVNPEHSRQTQRRFHMKRIAASTSPLKTAHVIALAKKRSKRTPEMDMDIINSNDSIAEAAKKHGISSGLVGKIRRGETSGNPWAGLMR